MCRLSRSPRLNPPGALFPSSGRRLPVCVPVPVRSSSPSRCAPRPGLVAGRLALSVPVVVAGRPSRSSPPGWLSAIRRGVGVTGGMLRRPTPPPRPPVGLAVAGGDKGYFGGGVNILGEGVQNSCMVREKVLHLGI